MRLAAMEPPLGNLRTCAVYGWLGSLEVALVQIAVVREAQARINRRSGLLACARPLRGGLEIHLMANGPYLMVWPTLVVVSLRSVGGAPMPHGQPDACGILRRFGEGDSVEELTRLLHRAYAGHAAAGRVFFASYQSVQDTEYRLSNGECWLAVRGDELLGTVTVAGPHTVPSGYPAPTGAGSFWQLAVDPLQRGTGLGQRLLALAEERVSALGATQVAIDTSAEATDLIGWYQRRGYVPVGKWRWDVTNYESVVLVKDLTPR